MSLSNRLLFGVVLSLGLAGELARAQGVPFAFVKQRKTTSVLFTTPGSFNWTVPANVRSVEIEVWGAGADGTIFNDFGFKGPEPGDGGSSGGYSQIAIAVTPGQVIPYAIGTPSDQFDTTCAGLTATAAHAVCPQSFSCDPTKSWDGKPGVGSGGSKNFTGNSATGFVGAVAPYDGGAGGAANAAGSSPGGGGGGTPVSGSSPGAGGNGGVRFTY